MRNCIVVLSVLGVLCVALSCQSIKVTVHDEEPAKVRIAEAEALRQLPPEAIAELIDLLEGHIAQVKEMERTTPSGQWASMMPDIIGATMDGFSSIIGKFTEPGTENLKEIFVKFFEEAGETARALQQFRADVVNRSIEVRILQTDDDADIPYINVRNGEKSIQIGTK